MTGFSTLDRNWRQKMIEWFKRNAYEINFFISGWCAFAALDNLLRGNYAWAAVNAGLAYLNIKLSKM